MLKEKNIFDIEGLQLEFNKASFPKTSDGADD